MKQAAILRRVSVLATLTMSTGVFAQAINVNFGQPDAGPPDTYAAAGTAGHWNSIVAPHGSTTFNLKTLDGSTTDVSVWQFGGTGLLHVDDPGVTGDDALMMNDFLVTYTSDLESCLFFRGLDLGMYKVRIYAWMPAAPEVLSYTNCDEESGNPHYSVGGVWPGGHEVMITHSEHIAEVSSGDGLLRVHSGIVPGEDPLLGAALNAVQIEPLVECPEDLDASGAVDFGDLLAVLSAWGACEGCPEDLDASGAVDFGDILSILAAWGVCG